MQPGLPLALEQVILKALAKKPDDRFQTAEAFATSLRQAATALANEDSAPLLDSTQNSVTSMVIELDSDPNLANTSRWLGDKRVRPPIYDRLLINREGEEAEVYSLYKRSFTIGRSENNDIILVGNNVSRWHARLTYSSGQWQINDAGSTNGTFLNGVKLKPDDAKVWSTDQMVRIGPFHLHIEIPVIPIEAPPPAQPVAEASPQPMPVAPIPPPIPAHGENITADMRPKQLKRSGICRVLLLNKGDKRSTVTISSSDPSTHIHFDASTKQVTLSPGQKGVVDFYLEAQKRPFTGRRQTAPFTMHVTTARQEWENLSGQLIITPLISIWLLLIFFILFLMLFAALVYGLRFLP